MGKKFNQYSFILALIDCSTFILFVQQYFINANITLEHLTFVDDVPSIPDVIPHYLPWLKDDKSSIILSN